MPELLSDRHSLTKRSGRRVALLAMYPAPDPAMPELISNHGLRMVEASLRAALGDSLDLHIYDLHDASVDDLTDEIEFLDPDVVGFSAYLWSFPTFAKVAERLHANDPSRLIVFGGPSARPSMLNQPPFAAARDAIDVLIINEGELTFVDIVEADDRQPQSLNSIRGIAQWDGSEWHETRKRPLGDLNELPSPYVMGLVPPGGLGVLQTYRGCPYTCSFCEWGTLESPKRVRTADHLAAEFAAMDRIRVTGALLVDAGLNLNSRAFDQLEVAAERTEFFAERKLICEVYPTKIKDQHIRFLRSVGQPLVGIGLQSFDNEVLAHVERNYEEKRFEDSVHELTDVARVAIEIIMGLPGDSPEQFRESFHRAREFPCALRVYHCCILPSALMVRAPENYALDYDPVSLKVNSCLGWSAKDIEQECDFLNQQVSDLGGGSGEYFWVFSAPQETQKIQGRRNAA